MPHLNRSLLRSLLLALLGLTLLSLPVCATVRVLITGQSMPRYNLRKTAPGAYETIKGLVADGQVVFTNFEGVVLGEGTGEPTREGTLLHVWDEPVMATLREAGFNLLSLANNHAFDLSAGGILSTRRAADRLGFVHAGTGPDLAAAAAAAFIPGPDGGKVALVAMASGSLKGDAAATSARPGVNALRLDEKTRVLDAADAQRILASIRSAAAQGGPVIAYHHSHYWEEPETKTPEWMKAWARACIDAGASAYVAQGVPLLHGLEIYRGRPIFYGLGNFIFQTTVDQPEETWDSFVVQCDFEGSSLKQLVLRPVRLNAEGQPKGKYVATRGLPAPLAGKEAGLLFQRFGALSREYGTEWTIDGERAVVKLYP